MESQDASGVATSVDQLCDWFEQALHAGERPDIGAWLQQAGTAATQALPELAAVELEFRLRQGEKVSAADYFDRFPALRDDPLISRKLLALERRLQIGDAAGADDTTHSFAVADTSIRKPVDSKAVSSQNQKSTGEIARIGDYELLGEVARGGMGVVHKARHRRLGRLAAVKLIKSGDLADPEEIKRFHAEAKAAAQLDHPNIVPVFEAGEHGGQHFIAMAFVDGPSLWNRAKESPLEPMEAARLMAPICRAIQFAHDRGIVHRDLKPQNILVASDGTPRVTDFGLAKRTHGDSNLTATGMMLGTPSYMAPEQAAGRNEQVGPLSDVYSLGATLYALVTGRPPFQAANPLETLKQVLDTDPVSPRTLNPAVPRDLETICLKCLQKEPGRRYESAQELAEELQRYLRHEPIVARPITQVERTWRWCRRNPVVATLSSVATLLALTLSIGGPILTLREMERSGKLEQVVLESQRQARASRSRFLAAESVAIGKRFPVRSLLLAAEAVRTTTRPGELGPGAAEDALRDALGRVGGFPLQGQRDGIRCLALSADGRTLATASDKIACVWDLSAPNPSSTAMYLHGHEDVIFSLALSFDGRTLVTGSSDHTFRVWDLSASDPVAAPKVLRTHKSAIGSCLALSPDGQLLVTDNWDEVCVWNLSAADPTTSPKILRGHNSYVTCMALSPDGQTLVTGSDDKTACVWNLSLSDPAASVKVLRGHEDAIRCLAISPDGEMLATGSESDDSTARVWDLSTPDPASSAKVLRGHHFVIECLAFNPDGQTLVTGSRDGTARIWDVSALDPGATAKVLYGHEGQIFCLAMSPDGRTLITGGSDCTSRVWDLWSADPATSPRILRGHDETIICMTLSADGRTLVTGSADDSTRIWDLSAPEPAAPAKLLNGHTDSIWHMTLSPDGRTLVTGSRDKTSCIWDLFAADPAVAPKVLRGHRDGIWCLAVSRDGRTLVTGSWDQTVHVWDLSATDPAASPKVLHGHETYIRCLALSPDGQTLVTGSDDKTACIWNLSLSDPAASVKVLRGHEDAIECLALSLDGQTLITGSGDSMARVWDLSAPNPNAQVMVLRGHRDGIWCLALGRDGQTLVTGSADATARVWDLSAADPATSAKVLSGHESWVTCLALSPDGQTLITGSDDDTARVWDLSALGPAASPKVLRGHTADIECLVLSRDRRTLITGSSDATARVWNLSAPDPAVTARVLRGHKAHINCLALSSDGRTLVTGSSDGEARVWDLRLDALLKIARSMAGRDLTAAERAPLQLLTEPATTEDPLADVELWPWQPPRIPTPNDPLWHEQQATDAEQGQHWFAAAFHLRKLAKLRPNDQKIKSRLAQAEALLDREPSPRTRRQQRTGNRPCGRCMPIPAAFTAATRSPAGSPRPDLESACRVTVVKAMRESGLNSRIPRTFTSTTPISSKPSRPRPLRRNPRARQSPKNLGYRNPRGGLRDEPDAS